MNQSYQAYTRASHTVGKTRQVVMLYDGAIRNMQQAIEAIKTKDFETRYHKLTRVAEIVFGLQSCLDFEKGGQQARALYAFYASIESRIYPIHRTNDIAECEAMIAQLKEMRDVWDRIDRGESAAGEPKPSDKPPETPSEPVTVSA